MDAETDSLTDSRRGPVALALQRDLAAAVAVALADSGWAEANLFWSEVAGHRLEALTLGGHSSAVAVPPAVDALGAALRREMAEPEHGAWLSMTLVMEADGGFTCRFNYDRRVYRGGPSPFSPGPLGADPDDEAWAHDLARYPRSQQHTAPWMPGARPDLADPYEVLDDAWGWPGVFASVEQQAAAALEAAGRPQTAAEAETIGRRVLSAVVADVLEPHHLATLLGLHREAAVRRLLPEVDGVESLDPTLTLIEARQSSTPALLAVEAGVYGIIGDVVRARLRP